MAAKRREFSVFSLSFLDIMSCGFGAVILIFIIINHSTEVESQEVNAELMAQVRKAEQMLETDQKNLVQLKNTVEETEDEIVTTEASIQQITQRIQELKTRIAALTQTDAQQDKSIEELKTEVKRLQEEAARLEGSLEGQEETGENLRTFVGEGDRQYLTGLKVGGENILILLDASASMLDKSIVNVVRRRNMSEESRRASDKWQRAIRTIEWIIANMPPDADFQLYTFNGEATPVIEGTEGQWLAAVEKDNTDKAMESLKQVVPGGGTSLHHPFAVARRMDPRPDNVFLIVDSLPTQGLEASKRNTISSPDRVKLFQNSLEELPQDIPVNVILFPMEGDPIAAPSFWRLAQITGGSFLSPSEDWP